MRSVFDWNIGVRSLPLGKRTLIMGILNVTPDSFSDGGLHFGTAQAVEAAKRMFAEGADIVDIGGESTRPGVIVGPAADVSSSEELRRVLPVIEQLKADSPGCLLSIDTYKASVAQAAVTAGAEILNDVSGCTWDHDMAKTLVSLKCGVVLMHTRGRPDQWRDQPPAGDIVTLVKRELRDRVDVAQMAGIKRDRIALDPGFGFGKIGAENYPLLRRFSELNDLRYPLVAGVSRKSFIGKAISTADSKPREVHDRLHGSLAAETVAVLQGAHIIRTHNVAATRDALRIADLVAS